MKVSEIGHCVKIKFANFRELCFISAGGGLAAPTPDG